MRSSVRALLVALALAVTLTSPAVASLIKTPLPQGRNRGSGFVGPALAGNRIVWATRTPDGYDVYTADLKGSSRVRQHVPMAPGRVDPAFPYQAGGQLAASTERLGVALSTWACSPRDDCDSQEYALYDGALTAELGGSLAELTVCERGEPCRGADSTCAPPQLPGPRVDVSDDVVVYEAGCNRRPVVRDFAAGADPAKRVLDLPSVRLAGDHVAAAGPSDPFGSHLVVSNWRTGTEEYEVPAAGILVHDIQEDGTVAYTVERDDFQRGLAWASLADPTEHLIEQNAPFHVRIAHDRIAYDLGGVRVRTLGGDLLGSAPTRGFFADLDFDGERAVWAVSPCAEVSIVVWRVDGPAPALPGRRCPLPHLRRRILASKAGGVRVPLACPRAAKQGCKGHVGIRWRGRYLTKAGGWGVAAARGSHLNRRRAFSELVCDTTGSSVTAHAVVSQSAYWHGAGRRVPVLITGLAKARQRLCDHP